MHAHLTALLVGEVLFAEHIGELCERRLGRHVRAGHHADLCTGQQLQLEIVREGVRSYRSTDEHVAGLVDEPHGAANALRDVHHEDLVARRVADRVQNVRAHRHVPIAVRLEHEAAQRRLRERPDLSRNAMATCPECAWKRRLRFECAPSGL